MKKSALRGCSSAENIGFLAADRENYAFYSDELTAGFGSFGGSFQDSIGSPSTKVR